MSGSEVSIRVLMQQPALPAFRVPFFRALAAKEGIDFRLLYADGEMPTVEADRFDAEHRVIRHLPGGLFWDGEHLKRMRRGDWDVHILTWNTRYLSLVPTIRLAKKRKAGVICWGHGYSKNEGPLRDRLRFETAKMSDAIVLYSRSVAASYIERGLPEEKVFVALNSLDPAPIQAAREKTLARPEKLEAFQKEHGLTGPVILYVSRLYPENRVDMLLDSTKALLADFPDLKTVIIGIGKNEDELRAQAERLGIEKHVIFAGQIYGEENIAPWFCSADMFCYPANIGLSILHAMNHALPVVTSDKTESQNPEIEALRDGENGLTYRHGDTDDMTRVLRRLLEDREMRERLGAEAHQTATGQYSTERMADGMEAAIRYAYEVARRRASS